MLSRLREHFGAAGLIVAIVALVAALAGGAIAANSGGGKATASAKAKKGPRGPKGAKGDAGAPGAAGPAGAQGPKGDTGSAGEEGEKGKEGKAGKDGAPGIDGEDGADGATGPAGPAGPEGSPWTLGGVLPPGRTETGAWSFGSVTAGSVPGIGQAIRVPISFPLPLPAALEEAAVHYLKVGETSSNCGGSAADPKAAPGHLCVYTGEEGGASSLESESIGDPSTGFAGAAKAGAILTMGFAEEGAKAIGTWAVTAPTAP